MKPNKVWHRVEIATVEQNISVYPTEGFDGIIVEIQDLDDKTLNVKAYLNQDEMEFFIEKMREMMNYVKK